MLNLSEWRKKKEETLVSLTIVIMKNGYTLTIM